MYHCFYEEWYREVCVRVRRAAWDICNIYVYAHICECVVMMRMVCEGDVFTMLLRRMVPRGMCVC